MREKETYDEGCCSDVCRSWRIEERESVSQKGSNMKEKRVSGKDNSSPSLNIVENVQNSHHALAAVTVREVMRGSQRLQTTKTRVAKKCKR